MSNVNGPEGVPWIDDRKFRIVFGVNRLCQLAVQGGTCAVPHVRLSNMISHRKIIPLAQQ